MTLKTIVVLIVGTLAAFAIGASAALVSATTSLYNTSRQLLVTSESLTASLQLEVNLLQFSRESILWAVTRDRVHLNNRQEAKDNLAHWFEESGRHVGSDEERILLNSARISVSMYLDAVAKIESEGRQREGLFLGFTKEVERPRAQLSHLTDINRSQALAEYARANRYDSLANFSAAIVLLGMCIFIPVLLYLVKSLIYTPVLKVKRAIHAIQEGKDVTALDRGALELKDISSAIVDMSSELKKRRDNQVRYMAAIAHDLRNPIGALKMSSEAVLYEFKDELKPDVVEMLEIIQRQSEYLDRQVSDLLDTARSVNDQLNIKADDQDLCQLVKSSCDLYRSYSANHRIVTKLPLTPVPVKVDSTRLSQVLNNLISNAIKYSPFGGEVVVEVGKEEKEVVVSVTDNGLGISPSEQQEIFQPFRRAKATRETIPGVGLGLYTARKIIQAHGGVVEVRSKEQEGATFVVRLPLADQHPPA